MPRQTVNEKLKQHLAEVVSLTFQQAKAEIDGRGARALTFASKAGGSAQRGLPGQGGSEGKMQPAAGSLPSAAEAGRSGQKRKRQTLDDGGGDGDEQEGGVSKQRGPIQEGARIAVRGQGGPVGLAVQDERGFYKVRNPKTGGLSLKSYRKGELEVLGFDVSQLPNKAMPALGLHECAASVAWQTEDDGDEDDCASDGGAARRFYPCTLLEISERGPGWYLASYLDEPEDNEPFFVAVGPPRRPGGEIWYGAYAANGAEFRAEADFRLAAHAVKIAAVRAGLVTERTASAEVSAEVSAEAASTVVQLQQQTEAFRFTLARLSRSEMWARTGLPTLDESAPLASLQSSFEAFVVQAVHREATPATLRPASAAEGAVHGVGGAEEAEALTWRSPNVTESDDPTAIRGTGGTAVTGMDAVHVMLRRARLESYAPAFEETGFDDLDYLMSLDSERLADVGASVGMKVGHLARLRHYVASESASRG